MKHLLVVACLLFLSSSAIAAPGKVLRNRGAIAGQYIVVLDDNAKQLSREVSRGDKGEVLASYRKAVNGFALRMTDSHAEALSRHPNVRYVEEDFTLSILDAAGNWSLDRLDQADLPLDLRYTYTEDGSGVTAYVIDTGIRASHVEFGTRVLPGFSSIPGGLTMDCGGHGTHVASILGGSQFGVAKNVSIVPVRVIGCNGKGSLSSVIAGLDWIAIQHVAGQPAVANMSLGGAASRTLDASVQAVIDRGITFVVAAGNSGIDACEVSPARVPDAITVGATDWTDARPEWSNQGSCVDLFAPGMAITGAWWNGKNTAISRMSGTSMAAPHAAGVAALYLSANPTASPAAVESMLRTSAAVGRVRNISPDSVNLLLQSVLTGATSGGGTSGGGGDVQELEDPLYETMGPRRAGIACVPSEIWTCYSIVEP